MQVAPVRTPPSEGRWWNIRDDTHHQVGNALMPHVRKAIRLWWECFSTLTSISELVGQPFRTSSGVSSSAAFRSTGTIRC